MSFLRPALRTTATASPIRTPIRTFTSTPANAWARMTIVGRLGGPPELQTTASGQEVVRYSLATNQNDKTNWWRVTSFQPAGASRDYLMNLGKG